MTLTLRGIICAWLLVAAGPAWAATLPAGFSESLVAAGLRNPTAMTFAPDGRLFVCEQGGRLRVISDGVLRPAPFVTLTVDASGERGLLGVAFDPAFETNHFVYVYYTARTPTVHNRVSRFTANGDVAVPGSERVIMDLPPLSSRTNHNGGAIHFGPDGKLYVAVGENANGANAQSLSTRLGKILRINRDGTIPPDNPFDAAVGVNRSIWARGLRNPFTFAFQPGTGTMFINDVGQNTWEEINEGVAGANYGWPVTEGPTTDPRFRSPLYSYNHSRGDCAISGGAFYNPETVQFPFAYRGAYFFADFCAGWIRWRSPGTGAVENFAAGIPAPVDLAVGADGGLYYLARGSGSNTGVVYRVDYMGPRISITANGQHGLVVLGRQDPLTVSLVFDLGDAPQIDPGEVYVGANTPVGTLWLEPGTGQFVPEPTRLFSGPVDSFGPVTAVNLPNASVLPSGSYGWFAIVDDDSNEVPDGTHFDLVLTVVP